MSEPTDTGIVQVRDVDPATLAVLRDRARSLGQSLSGYLRDLMDADAAAETNAEVIARIARDREPVDLTMDDILAARDEGRRLASPTSATAPLWSTRCPRETGMTCCGSDCPHRARCTPRTIST